MNVLLSSMPCSSLNGDEERMILIYSAAMVRKEKGSVAKVLLLFLLNESVTFDLPSLCS